MVKEKLLVLALEQLQLTMVLLRQTLQLLLVALQKLIRAGLFIPQIGPGLLQVIHQLVSESVNIHK